MAFTSCAIAGAVLFHLFHAAPASCRTRDAAHDQGREVAPLMRHRTPRTSQRCGPAGTYAACRSRSGSNGYRQHCGRVAAQYRLAVPKEESRCLWQWAKRPPESAAMHCGLVGRAIQRKCMPSGRVKSAM
nr:MAG TPA: hypothetical protein [Caudoviricetes sp.]